MKKILSVLALSAFIVPVAHAQEAPGDDVVIVPEVTETCTRSPILSSGGDICGDPVVVVETRTRTRSFGRSSSRSRRAR